MDTITRYLFHASGAAQRINDMPLNFKIASPHFYRPLAIATLCMVMFCYGLWGVQDYIGFNTRFALFVIEMLRDGPSFFPTTYGEPYPDYPATSTLLIWSLARLLNTFNYLVAILPSAIAASITLILLYQLLAKYSVQWAWLAVIFALLTPQFTTEARMISLDQMVATVTMAVFYLAHRADTEDRPALLGWDLLITAVGFAFRGPIGLVLPTGAITGYFLVARRWRWLILYGCCALLLLLLCGLAWLGTAWLDGERVFGPGHGSEFIHKVIHWQVGLRLSAGTGNNTPFFHYFLQGWSGYALSFPLGIITLSGLVLTVQKSDSHPEFRKLCWGFAAFSLIILIGMSVPTGKKMRYLLPMVPGLAALAAYPLIGKEGGIFRVLRACYRVIILLIPGCGALLLALCLLLAQERMAEIGVDIRQWRSTFYGLIAAMVVMQSIVLWSLYRYRASFLLPGLAAVISVWLITALVVEPMQRIDRNTRNFVAAAEQIRARSSAPLVFYQMGKDAMALKYMVNLNHPEKPLFIDSPEELAKRAGPVWIVGRSRDLQPLAKRFAGQIMVAIPSAQFDGKAFSLYRFLSADNSRE